MSSQQHDDAITDALAVLREAGWEVREEHLPGKMVGPFLVPVYPIGPKDDRAKMHRRWTVQEPWTLADEEVWPPHMETK